MARRFNKHAMLGTGGNIRVPRSESAEIDRVLSLLQNGGDEDITESITTLKRLRSQVVEGFHRNPPVEVEVVGVLSHDARTVAYRHAKDSKLYKHDFERGSAEVLAINYHGKRALLLVSPDGLPLWDEF